MKWEKFSELDLNYFDFYDWDLLDKIRDKRTEKELKLFVKSKRGDKKAQSNLVKFMKEDEILKEKATNTGYFWY